MKEKKNEFWWLDLLEVKFTNVTPRFGFTKKLINAHNNSHLLKKLPSTRNDALKQIHALKTDLFIKKAHGAQKKMNREVIRIFKQQRSKSDRSEKLDELFNDKEFVTSLVTAKLAKIISAAILTNKELKSNPPSYFSPELINVITDKSNACNPTTFYIEHCQNDKVVNGYISKLWNSKEMKALSNEIDWTFRKIRGNLTKEEIAQHSKTSVNVKSKDNQSKNGDDSVDSEIDSDEEESNSDSDDEDMDRYDHLVAGSDSEMSDDAESEIEGTQLSLKKQSKEKKEKKEKQPERKLPQLASGYFSGGSDDEDDVDNDKVVKEATTVRKNRRGQRARQKIWEQKYGQKANHVQQENNRIASEREKKQQEFEERQRKRDLKAKMAADLPDGSAAKLAATNKLHPSWEARKLAEQKQKDVKFTGKKITFD
ncbi:hypothetical protein PUMCH_000381 [Australozyma saopauloensis]|uniref:Bud22 domain-containing protein n=1 Tax=Australozyma saopauloensis TaxID=291208 RepID=A0AAX4H4M7_9ASCO|nr:hypothetical protein PUMCH_000381 [[Candida] saopauloensis]